MDASGLRAFDEGAEVSGGDRVPPDPTGNCEIGEAKIASELGALAKPGKQRTKRRGAVRGHVRGDQPVVSSSTDIGTPGHGESNPAKVFVAHSHQDAALRLRIARQEAGYTSGSKFARKLKMNIWTYLRYERGVQPITPAIDAMFTRELRIETGMILFGRPSSSDLSAERQVPIVGVLRGPIGKVFHSMPAGMTAAVPAYVPSDFVSIMIDDDALYPAYRAGDRVFFRPLNPDTFEARNVHTLECVVELASGEQLVRQVFVQANGLCTLNAYHAHTELDQHVVAAEPIEIVFRHMRRR